MIVNHHQKNTFPKKVKMAKINPILAIKIEKKTL